MSDASLLLTVGAGCMLVASLLSKGSVRIRRTLSPKVNPERSSSFWSTSL